MAVNITSMLIFQNLRLPEYQEKITTCAGMIMERYSEVQSSIVYENVGKLADNILGNEMTNTTRIINIQKYSQYRKHELEPYYMLTIIIKNLDELRKYFNSVYRILGWNSRAKHFIIYIGYEDILEIFQLSWHKYIIRLVVMDRNQDLYTYYPMENNNCGRLIRKHFLFNCKHMRLRVLDGIFDAKPLTDYSGCKVKVMTFPVIPYVINVDDTSNPGYEIKALNLLGERMNFSIEYVKHNYTYWGVMTKESTYTQMYNGFFHREADIMLGMLVANGTYLYDFEASVAHTKSDLAFFVPPAQKEHPWENISKVYSNMIWITIGVTVVAMILFWNVMAYIQNAKIKFTSLSLCTIYVLGVMVGKAMLQPKTHTIRYIFIIWTFYCLILTSFPLRTAMDQAIQRFIQSGLMEKWIQEVTYKSRTATASTEVALNMQHIIFPVGILGIGYGVALITLVLELVCKRIGNDNKTKLN